MLRLILLFTQSLLCLAAPSNAAIVPTVVPWLEPERPRPPENEMGTEALAAIFTEHSFETASVAVPMSPITAIFHVFLVVALVAAIARRLPRVIPSKWQWLYAAAAFPASSWIRATMARRPFERCDDRWSCNPSLPSSVPASTFKTSRTANPL